MQATCADSTPPTARATAGSPTGSWRWRFRPPPFLSPPTGWVVVPASPTGRDVVCLTAVCHPVPVTPAPHQARAVDSAFAEGAASARLPIRHASRQARRGPSSRRAGCWQLPVTRVFGGCCGCQHWGRCCQRRCDVPSLAAWQVYRLNQRSAYSALVAVSVAWDNIGGRCCRAGLLSPWRVDKFNPRSAARQASALSSFRRCEDPAAAPLDAQSPSKTPLRSPAAASRAEELLLLWLKRVESLTLQACPRHL